MSTQSTETLKLPPLMGPASPPTPILHYSFDNDTDATVHDSAGAYDGSISNPTAVQHVPDRTGFYQALSLNGQENYVAVPNVPLHSSMTVSMWIYFGSYAQTDNTLFQSGTGPGSFTLNVHNEGSAMTRSTYFTFRVQGNSGGDFTDDTVRNVFQRLNDHEADLPANNMWWGEHPPGHFWEHIAVAYDANSKEVTFYLNGRVDAVKSFKVAQNPVLSGGRMGAAFTPGQSCVGTFDAFVLYDHALSPSEAQAADSFEQDLWAVRDAPAWQPPKTTIYVDAVNGNDNNSGTSSSNALRTLGAGLAHISQPGTKLSIAAGLYRESNLTLNQSGTRFMPITIEGAGPNQTIVSGSIPFNDGWTSVGNNTYTHAWPYKWGFQAGCNYEPLICRRETVLVNNVVLRPYLDASQLTPNSFAVDETAGVLTINSTVDPRTAAVEIPTAINLLTINGSFIVLRGISFTNAANNYTDPAVGFGYKGAHFLVEDVQVLRLSGRGLYMSSADMIVRRFVGKNVGNCPLYADITGSFLLFEDVDIVANAWRTDWGGYTQPDPAALCKNMFNWQVLIRRMNIMDNQTKGAWWDSGNWVFTVQDSYIARNPSGAWDEANPQGGVQILSSEVVDNQGSGLTLAHAEQAVLVDDVFAGPSALSSWEPQQLRADPDADQYYIDGSSFNVTARMAPPLVSGHQTFVNNIVSADMAGDPVIQWPNWNTYFATMNAAHNTFSSPNGSDNIFSLGSQGTVGFNAWKQNVPQDTTSTFIGSNVFAVDGNTQVSFAVSEGSLKPSVVPIVVPIKLSKPTDTLLTVQVDFTDGSAKQGVDYFVKSPSTVVFQPKQRMRPVVLAIPSAAQGTHNDFTITLSNVSTGARLGQNPSLHVYIIAP